METGQERLKEILAEALARTDPSARAAYLAEACAGDAALRSKVEALIAAYEKHGDAVEKTLVVRPSLVQEGPGTVIGRYKLLQEIGEGGFGVVFMAEQLEPVHRQVALKIIKAGMDTREVIARFEAERQALALMDHPNIARVLDAGATESGRPYFVMELVKGIRITDYCDQNDLPTEERLKLFMQVCHAVQHAHQKGIIHRDLKPSNVMVTLHDGEPVPKVIDFGIAKATGQRLTDKTLFTRYEQMIGTPAYMSPEQAAMSGLDVDTRTDIYALGVLLYELLTGVTPFDKETLAQAAFDEIRRLIQETEPPKPSTRLHGMGEKLTEVAKHRHTEPGGLRRSLRGDLDWIVMKALEKDRRRRYETANDLAGDLERHLEHQPVVAGPPNTVYRARKFIRRHRLGVAFAAALVVALALGLVTSLIGFAQARHERDRSLTAEQQARHEWDRAVTAERQTAQERNHAELLAAEAALAQGQSKLETGDSWGLLDMVEAFDIAKHTPALQEPIGRRWSTWHAYWDRLTIAVRPMRGTPSPDYLQFVSVLDWPPANTSRVVHVYDTLSGAQIVGPLRHDSAAVGCAFSPDGRLLATLTQEGFIHLWDRRTGIPVRPPCATGVIGLEYLAFSPCGRYLVAFAGAHDAGLSKAALVRLDQAPGPAQILGHRYPVNQARFSPDGELLAILCKPDLQLWRTSDLQPLGLPIAVTMDHLLEFSPDGRQLAFNPSPATGVGLLDTRTQQMIRMIPAGEDKWNGMFSHDGRLLACFDDAGGTLEIWNVQSGIRPYPAHELDARFSGLLTFSPDDSLLAAGSADGRIHVLRTSDGEIAHAFHAPPLVKAAFLTNGTLAGHGSNLGHFWDLAATPLPGMQLPGDALGYALAFDTSGRLLAIGGEGELRLWLMQPSPTLERVVSLPGRVLVVTFSEAEGRFVAFTDEGTITLVNSATGNTTVRGNCSRGYELSASLSPDGRRLALFRYAELVLVNTQTATVHPINDGLSGTLSAAFKPDSTAMLVGFAGGSTVLYDATSKTNERLGTAGFEGNVEGVAFHPGGNLLAMCIGERGLHLYDSERKRDVGGIRKTFLSKVNLVRFSGDGSLLAVAGPARNGGQAVELWQVDPQRGLFASGVFLPHDHPIWSVAFSPDNRTLVVGGLGTTRLWHLPSAPKELKEIQSRTWATLGFHLDEQGQKVYVRPPRDGVEKLRARLTEKAPPSTPLLDAALKLTPTNALAALEKLAAQYPGTNSYQTLLGRAHADLAVSKAEQGMWTEALVHADEAIRLGWNEARTRYLRALVCLGGGDVEAYRATCRAMTGRYKSSNDPDVIGWVGWSASLAPAALDDYTGIIEQVCRAVPRVSGLHGPAYRFYLGAVLLRGGQYQAAAAELEQVDRHLQAHGAYVDFPPIYDEFLLAICHARLGNEATARKWYEAGQVDVRNRLKPDQGGKLLASTTAWNRRLTIRLLQEEAESLLGTPPGPASSR